MKIIYFSIIYSWVSRRKELLTLYLAQQPHIAQASGVSAGIVSQIQSILGWPATRELICSRNKGVDWSESSEGASVGDGWCWFHWESFSRETA